MNDVVHHFSDGIYAKEQYLAKGYKVMTHSHNYSHLSILGKGSAVVTCDGIEKTYNAPACIEIKADVHHEIYALEDVTWFCIHKTDETDINKIDETLIKE